jgi:hypothetical protein
MHDARVGLKEWMTLAAALVACVPGTDKGGELVDDESGAQDGASEGADDGATSNPDDGPEGGSMADTGIDDGTCPPEIGAPCPGPEPLCGDAPVCGNGTVEAGEECDGGRGCDACAAAEEPTTLATVEGLRALAVGADGSTLALVVPDDLGPSELHRYDASGAQQWVVNLKFEPTWPDAIALDAAGNAYWATGVSGADPLGPWIGSWAPNGGVRWNEASAIPGYFSAIAVDGDLVVAALNLVESEPDLGSLRAYDADGNLVWLTQHPWRPEAVAITGAEAVGVFREPIVGTSSPAHLVRVDGDGLERWSIALATEDDGTQQRHQLIADGLGGSWVAGLADLGPWAAHHDADGVELEVLDCLGGHTGWIQSIALDAAGQPVFGVYASTDTPADSHAWVAHVQDGVVTHATSFFSDNGGGDHVVSLGRRSDGALLAGWIAYGEEGGPGSGQVVTLPP